MKKTNALKIVKPAKVKKLTPLTVYRKALSSRMQELRGERLTQKNVASSMQVGLDAYKKWEQRGALPLDYVERFANLVGSTVHFIVTGRGDEPGPLTIDLEATEVVPKRRRVRRS